MCDAVMLHNSERVLGCNPSRPSASPHVSDGEGVGARIAATATATRTVATTVPSRAMPAVATSMRCGDVDDVTRTGGVPRVSGASESNSSTEDALNPGDMCRVR